MASNAAYAPTVTWLPELAPTLDARDVARETFERQTGAAPDALYTNEALGVWGWVSADAVMLFRIPRNGGESGI